MGKEIDAIANLGSFSSSSSMHYKPKSLSPFDETVMLVTNTIASQIRLHRVATITDHFSVSQAMPLILSVFLGSCYSKFYALYEEMSRTSPRLDSFDCCSLSLECQEHPLKRVLGVHRLKEMAEKASDGGGGGGGGSVGVGEAEQEEKKET
ncbi:hypothetical protein Bca52824_032929 [Brassica carinata]|uniref:Uncharacterized protein n=1 Tax=Brassica carinata TaxID=52824 RepID=A0A8X7SDQ7_BRACI|nr:hypothetical protein Bca52824_032929 [Brassica carinata]